jgi:DDE superfamily endonuclease
VTRSRSSRGGGRRGRRENGSEGAACLAVFRGQGRWRPCVRRKPARGAGVTRQIAVPGKGSGRVSMGRVSVCSAWSAQSVDLPHPDTAVARVSDAVSPGPTTALLDAAHQQLSGPIVLIWDTLNTHVSAVMRALIAARDWLHVIRLPPYSPDPNPVEHVWSRVKPGQPHRARHRSVGRGGEEPAQADPVPARVDRCLRRSHWAGP